VYDRVSDEQQHRSHTAVQRVPDTGTTSSLLSLQQSAGNQAVSSMLGVQRIPENPWFESISAAPTSVPPAPEPAPEPSPEPAPTGGETGTTETPSPGESGITRIPGVLEVDTLVANTGVISPSYTPGAGNIW
jgi:hypothetical protein